MSLGYAEKLSYIEDVGDVGMKEHFDPPRLLHQKIERLSMMIKKSKHLVVFTGAGISTSCGIPDFRGPKGIWTLQRDGKALPQASLPFHRAMPGMTHMALVELEKAGILKFVISQNVDGLHLRSGIPRDKLAELHGNSFLEACPSCGTEYLRDFEVETVGLKETSRICSNENCGAKLRDTVLDWEDALPSREMSSAEDHCTNADIVLCLGTSLQITPACNLPLKSLRGGGKIVIVNLQKTPKDKKASLVIHGLVDTVIAGVMNLLNLQIPPFVRIDYLHVVISKALSADERYVNWTLQVTSVHGRKSPVPFVKSVEISFPEEEKYKAAILDEPPFLLKRRTERTRAFEMAANINFMEGCGCDCTRIIIPFDPKLSTLCSECDSDSILQNLRDEAIQDSSCGQTAVIGRKSLPASKGEVTVYAIVTNIRNYTKPSKGMEAELASNGTVKKRKRSRKGSGTSRKTPKEEKHVSTPQKEE